VSSSHGPCDVAVIGGGLVGISLCYELVDRGMDVVLVDRHHEGRATDAGAGILSPETFLDTDDDWVALAQAAGEHHARLTDRVAQDGGEGTGRVVCGLMRISSSEPEDEWIDKALALSSRRSPGVVERIDPSEALSSFPPLAPVRCALYSKAAARIDGRHAAQAIASVATARGLRTVYGEALSLVRDGDSVSAVETTDGTVAAGHVAICGGAWSERFGSQLGVSLPVSPMKGQIIHMSLPGANSSTWPIVQPVFSHYLVPWPDGRVACGGTMESGAGFDTRPTAKGVHELLRECLKTAPGLAQATLLEVRVGLRPASADDRPIVGRVPGWSNIDVVTGHGTEGLLVGPYTSALVAESILSGTESADIAFLSPARFA
jgi:glycine/D-amino acid oxidase-like deaminating enzyme